MLRLSEISLSTRLRSGIEGAVTARVTEIPALAQPILTASESVNPSYNAAAPPVERVPSACSCNDCTSDKRGDQPVAMQISAFVAQGYNWCGYAHIAKHLCGLSCILS